MVYPSFMLGVDGTISGTSAVFPRETFEMLTAVENKDFDRALAIHERVAPVWRAIDYPDFPGRAKYAVTLTGSAGRTADAARGRPVRSHRSMGVAHHRRLAASSVHAGEGRLRCPCRCPPAARKIADSWDPATRRSRRRAMQGVWRRRSSCGCRRGSASPGRTTPR